MPNRCTRNRPDVIEADIADHALAFRGISSGSSCR